jgi:hypothetical protein
MKAEPLVVYLPDTRGVTLSRYGRGNYKIGLEVFTFSRPPGRPGRAPNGERSAWGTCPGSTVECEAICYAKRIAGPVQEVHRRNAWAEVPAIPDECRYLRIHVSGDFDSIDYIDNWRAQLLLRPDIIAWAYTRSWRVPHLLPALEALRALPNLQLFASMDPSTTERPPVGWRRAWIHRAVARDWPTEVRLSPWTGGELMRADDGVPALVCPEELGTKPNCVSCNYCLKGQRNDVVFLEH